MFSKVFAFTLGVASFFIASSAIPVKVRPAGRQFIFSATTDGPASVTAPAPTPPVAEVAIETEDMGAAMSGTLEEVPVASSEPMVGAEPMAGEMPELGYNIGGGATPNGKFEADPIEYIVGETSFFEIDDAVIGGADPENVEIYKSHRYGMLGSTWGYDIPVDTPGNYDCTLHYAETYSEFFNEEANRTFMVEVSGDGSDEVQSIREMDVMVELKGAEFTALTKTFENVAIATTLKIRETPTIGDAFLSGITCVYVSSLE